MPVFVRNLLAVIAGVVVGSIVNMAIVTIGMAVIPLPEGVDMTTPESMAENFGLLRPVNFIAPWVAHAMGTLAGAWTVAKLGVSHNLILALGIGAFFLLGGITMVVAIGGPLWFIVLDLIGAYLPMGYLGGILAGKRHATTE